jgi:uncharacterized membrane protein
MAMVYIVAGINHFRVPKMYLHIIPPALPRPKAINAISGLAELLLGIALCIPQFSAYAAWGIIVLLIAVYPANVYMFTNRHAAMGVPKWLLAARLPLQAVLIVWAYLYT